MIWSERERTRVVMMCRIYCNILLYSWGGFTPGAYLIICLSNTHACSQHPYTVFYIYYVKPGAKIRCCCCGFSGRRRTRAHIAVIEVVSRVEPRTGRIRCHTTGAATLLKCMSELQPFRHIITREHCQKRKYKVTDKLRCCVDVLRRIFRCNRTGAGAVVFAG